MQTRENEILEKDPSKTFSEIDFSISCSLLILLQERDNFQEHLIQMASKSDVYRTHLERLHIVSYSLCNSRL